MAGVALDRVTKCWGGFVGVEALSLDIADRELLVLLDPSGCGKTTTMRMVAGLETPSSGTIRIGERVVNDLEPKDRDVAMVFQSYGLYPNRNVYENICFPLKVRRVPKGEHEARVMRAAEMVELVGFLDAGIARFERESGIRAIFDCEAEDVDLAPRVCREVARIVQEALQNVRKHSRARNVVVRFERAPGMRGTVVRVEMQYKPPGGMIGAAVANLFGKAPELQLQEDLRRLKQVIEVGEVVQSDASIHRAPHPAQPPAEPPPRAGAATSGR